MKPAERDTLLIRLDERSSNILNLTEAQEKHLRAINSHLEDHSKRLVIVETQIEERTVSKVNKKTLAGIGGSAIALATLVFYLLQVFGG